jgi:hypothetical protein
MGVVWVFTAPWFARRFPKISLVDPPREVIPAVPVATPPSPGYEVRLVPAEGLPLSSRMGGERESYAHLAVRALGGRRRRTYVRLEAVHTVLHGHLIAERIQQRLLRWSSREPAFGENKQWLNIPADDSFHNLDFAVINRFDHDHFTLVTADPGDRVHLYVGAYRVVVTVASDTEDPRPLRLELFVLRGRRIDPPSPLEVYWWTPHGENWVRESRTRAERRTDVELTRDESV